MIARRLEAPSRAKEPFLSNPFSKPLAENPFLAHSTKAPWWLRDSTEEELETHRRLTDDLTKLTNEHEQTR